MNYFDLFGLAPAFDLDLTQLTNQYRTLQRQHHPDQLAARADTAPVSTPQSAVNSAAVNDSYETLRMPAKRAAYMLALKGQAIQLEQSIGDLDFLQNALEVREQLDEADGPEILASLRQEITQWLDALSNEFKIDYAEDDWPEARDTCRKLAFMQRILNDIDKAEDQFDDLDDFDE